MRSVSAAVLLVLFAFLPAAAAEAETTHGLSLGGHYGLAEELVFAYYPPTAPADLVNQPYLLSRLDWEILAPLTLEYDFRLTGDSNRRWELGLGADIFVHPGFGSMRDYDWLAVIDHGDYDYEDYLFYSRSDVFVSGYAVDAAVRRFFSPARGVRVGGGARLSISHVHWDDLAWEKLYYYDLTAGVPGNLNADAWGDSFGGIPAIIYDQWMLFPVLEAIAEWSSDDFALRAVLYGSPAGFALDSDQHLLKSVQWFQVYFPVYSYGAAASATWFFGRRTGVELSVDAYRTVETYGPIYTNSLASDPETSAYGGIARRDLSVSMGVVWR